MRRNGFILGLFSVGGQVLLLRQLISSFNGDELLVGTALFGWFFSVALGAFIGGQRTATFKVATLMIIGALLIPIMVVAIRLAPMLLTGLTGEVIPFVPAALVSMAAMFPVGIMSGWLFPVISSKSQRPAVASIATVYLFEGIGAFVGGLAITLGTGELVSTLAMSIIILLVVIFSNLKLSGKPSLSGGLIGLSLLIAAIVLTVPRLDHFLESILYQPHTVSDVFDTNYGHQAILERQGSIALLTDNTLEAVFPDRQSAEIKLLPPLIYHPHARRILYIGRAEFGLAQLAFSPEIKKLLELLRGDTLHLTPDSETVSLSLEALDRRKTISQKLDEKLPVPAALKRIDDDPVTFLTQRKNLPRFDIIILDPGLPDNYQTARCFTGKFFSLIASNLEEDGLLYIPLAYDTDRYISSAKKVLLATIYRSLKNSFAKVTTWPGGMTLFLASNNRDLDLPFDSIITMAAGFPDEIIYMNQSYLHDRLAPMKTDRLHKALKTPSLAHSIDQPVLTHYQARYRSTADGFDRRLLGYLLGKTDWLYIFPALIILFFIYSWRIRGGNDRYALFLFFTAGIVSLSLELISFYLYQTTAGSLYSELAILIGTFMLGLSLGTYYARKIDSGKALELPALIMMSLSILIFAFGYDMVEAAGAIYFHACFLFVVAVATGTLFVAACNRFYASPRNRNIGAGYASEIAGSSIGALLTTTFLLPVIGLAFLLWSLLAITLLALIGSFRRL